MISRAEAINSICGIKHNESFEKAKIAINKIYDSFSAEMLSKEVEINCLARANHIYKKMEEMENKND